jgi:hypothetical protein
MLKVKRNRIWITFQKEGMHYYPAAATDPLLKTGGWDDVSFLGTLHRHIFHVRVEIDVFHNDRDIEFIQFKRWLEKMFNEGLLELNYKSCEMIADDIANCIHQRYPDRCIIVSVAEDNENGAIKHYEVE